MGLRFASVAVDRSLCARRSNYNFIKLIKVSLLVLTSYTTIPLRLASVLGFLFTIFGFFVLFYVLFTYFTQGSVPGFSFQASIIALFSGVQLFSLGIIGEYLARVFERTGGRKSYIIGRTTDEEPNEGQDHQSNFALAGVFRFYCETGLFVSMMMCNTPREIGATATGSKRGGVDHCAVYYRSTSQLIEKRRSITPSWARGILNRIRNRPRAPPRALFC
jgi:hypothetical protein